MANLKPRVGRRGFVNGSRMLRGTGRGGGNGRVLREDWEVVDALAERASALPVDEREPFLRRELQGKTALLAAAIAIVDALEGPSDFLEPGEEAGPPLAPVPDQSRFGAWAVDGVIARGGMGTVYAVSRSDGGFEQQGALKLIEADEGIDHDRFRRERQVLAELDHPGIARVFDGGVTDDGRPWMVMERIDGGPIDRWCSDRQLAFAARVRLSLDLIDAVTAAHRKLILHRDIKPGNVLVDTNGHVRVIDFGIAKRVGLGDRTEGVLPLSAPYAAPELLTGEVPGPPTDVYGVAALLYELASGQPPIALDGLPVALGIGRVLDETPKRLRALSDTTPLLRDAPARLVADLDAILAKALRKKAEDRYPTLEALAQDLTRALETRVVEARSGDRAYTIRRGLWRARWPIAAGLALTAALGGGLVATTIQKREAVAARDAALAAEARSDAVRQSLYLLLAESVELAGADASSRDVLAHATDRIAADFAGKPDETAAVLHALGELHFYLGDYAAAKATLTPIVTKQMRSLPPETLALARYDLAQTLIRMGDIGQAKPLLTAAQTYWLSSPVKWRGRLIDSRLVEAQIVRSEDPAAAAALLERALADHAAMHGSRNRQAGVFQNNLGVTLQAMGDMSRAAEAFRAARDIWQKTGLEKTPDALNTLNNLAAIEVLSGHPDRAEPLFAEAVAIRRSLFGASAGTAALLSNHGKTLLQLGRNKEALVALGEAAPMAERFAGTDSMHHVAALAGLSEAQVATGSVSALETAERAVAAAAAGKLPPPGRAMALLALARARAGARDIGGARAALADAKQIIAQLGPAAARLAEAARQVERAIR